MKNIRFMLLSVILISFTGCAQIPNMEGEGITRGWKTPFFSDTISTEKIQKKILEDGTVVREAEKYSHDTTVLGGWGRTVTAEKVRFEVKEDKKD